MSTSKSSNFACPLAKRGHLACPVAKFPKRITFGGGTVRKKTKKRENKTDQNTRKRKSRKNIEDRYG